MSYLPLSILNFIFLLHLHLLIYSIYFSIHKYIDLLRPYIDPTSPPQFLLFSLHDHHHRHHISIVFSYTTTITTTTFLLFPSTTTTTTASFLLFPSSSFFLLFSLLLLLLPLLLISIVFLEKARGQNQALTFEFRLLGVILAPLTFSRENNRNEEEEEEEKQKNEEEEGNNRIYMQGKAPTRIIFNIVYYLCRTLAIQRQTTRIWTYVWNALHILT